MRGRQRRSASARAAAILTLAVIACAPPTGAGAATQVGETFVPQNNCDPGATHLQSSSPGDGYTVGFRGVITSWSHRAGPSPGQVKLKVGRPLGGSSFWILAESGFFAPTAGSLLNVPAQIPVLPGDVIGSYVSNAACGRSALGTGHLAHYLYPGDPAPGTTSSFLGPAQYQVDIAAVLEPDCDNDGFGDESQDQNLDACPPGPAATITSGPPNKVKTKKNRATATFIFTADDADATFNCALDGKQELEPCVSPLTVTVRRGEHTFSVTATDAGGNAGAAATDTFKVKRKRKKKK